MPSPLPRDRVSLAVELLTAMTTLGPSVSVAELAASLGWPADERARVVAGLEKAGILATIPDPSHEGSTRVRLSMVARRRIGLPGDGPLR